MDFIYLFRVLLKRKFIILLSGVVAAGLAYYFTKNEPKKFLSRAQISTGFTATDEVKLDEGAGTNPYETDSKFNNAIVTLTSDPVKSLLTDTLILHDLQSPQPFRILSEEKKKSPIYQQINKEEAIKIFRDKLENMTMLTSFRPEEKKLLEFQKLYDYYYKTIYKYINAYQLQRTDYIEIDAYTENPELSAFMVNNLFQQFLRYYQKVRGNRSMESIDTLKSIMDKKKQELDEKNRMAKGEVLGEGINSADAIANLQQTLLDERSKLNKLYADERKINQKLAEKGNIKTTPTVNTNDELIALKEEKDKAYRDYLNSGLTDKNLEEKYNTLRTQYLNKYLAFNSKNNSSKENEGVDDLVQKKSELDIDIETQLTNIGAINSQIAALRGAALRQSGNEVLEKQIEQANTEYLAARKRYYDALDQNSSSGNNFKQVLVGQPSIEPEPSKRKLIVGFAGIAAMITTILIISLLTYLDSSVKTPVIFGKTVGLKLISMVNFMNLKKQPLAEIVAKKNHSDNKKEKERHNVFRESLRKLRYAIETSGKKIFLFSSTRKGEGKTTLIQALSYSMSLSKKKILIIDTNFCNNDLTVQLGADPILETITLDTANSKKLLDQIKDVSKDVGVGTVFAIGSEGGDYTPSEVLPRNNLLQHLQTLTQEFDYIFLEGPPLNDFSDARELVQYVDGVIAIFSADHIIKQIDRESINFYHELNGKFCGAVLNMVDLSNVNVT